MVQSTNRNLICGKAFYYYDFIANKLMLSLHQHQPQHNN